MKISLMILALFGAAAFGCRYDQFECRNGQCIPWEYANDGEYLDCDDCSDESRWIWTDSCFRATPSPPPSPTAPPQPPPPPPPSAYGQCGVQSHQPDLNPAYPVRYGGSRYADNAKEANRHSWPWQVLIGHPFHGGSCGGTIIAPDLVVTAAHCVSPTLRRLYPDGTEICVWAGLHSESDKDVPCKLKGKLIAHKSFLNSWGRNPVNDIALLKLNQKLQFNDKVNAACLPETAVEPGTECFLTGWGRDARQDVHYSEWESPNELTQATQVVQRCNSEEERDMICAKGPRVNKPGEEGANNESACKGDSGGPLVCKSNSGRWVLHGVVSKASRDGPQELICGSGNIPGVTAYANVLHHKDFITSLGKIQT